MYVQYGTGVHDVLSGRAVNVAKTIGAHLVHIPARNTIQANRTLTHRHKEQNSYVHEMVLHVG